MAVLLYCDTSALLKLYVAEAGSEQMRQRSSEAEALAVCRIAWAEACSAFARRSREVPADAGAMAAARRALAADWPRYVVLEVSQPVVERAGEYANAFALRAYDSVQLAAAQEAALRTGLTVDFACFDSRLNSAARLLGLNALFAD